MEGRRTGALILPFLILTSFLVVALGGVAGAHQFTDNTNLTIHKNHPNPYDKDETVIFKGKANADHKFCRKHRRVSLFKKRPGPDRFIESDITGGRGRYKVVWESARLGTHRFYTKVKPKVGGQHPHRHVCRRDTSRTVKVVVKQLPG
jgi:hypothetical protein